ncbi:MAG: lysine exporter LysO family protein [Clostridiales bacterium]|jgi:uncharacterized membrane protein YbjE (DUF340 family)|nr:lysine exporter LysO family protein [Clostridiales bacterium]
MTKAIVVSVIVGVLSGYFFVPDIVVEFTQPVVTFVLCLFLFVIGLDIGRQKTILADIKRVGFRVLLIPIAIIVGTLVGGAIAGLLLPISVMESMAVSAGMGWYSLAPAILMDYSPAISAISFLHNVMREVFGIILIPIIAKKVGFIECISLPGASCMDIAMPMVKNATSSNVAIYSFLTGIVLSITIPIIVPLLINLC